MKGFRGMRWQLWRKDKDTDQNNQSHPDSQQSKFRPISELTRRLNMTPKLRTIAISAVAVFVLGGGGYFATVEYVEAHTVAFYRVYVGEQEIGTIEEEQQLQALFQEKQEEYSEKYPGVEMAVHTEGIKAVPDQAYKAEVNSEETLDKLYGMLTGYAKGVELKVDGKTIAIVKDQETADQILEQIKTKYAPELKTASVPAFVSKVAKTGGNSAALSNAAADTGATEDPDNALEKVSIKEQVDVQDVDTAPNKVMAASDVVAKILEGDEAAITYEVREGDTISSIAAKYGVTQQELFNRNPGVKERTLQIGTELQIQAVQPALTVTTVERVSEQLVTEPQVIIQKSDEMRAGETKVLSLGESGLKTMKYRVTKENGEVVEEEWLGQEVIKESKPKVVLAGTKIVRGIGTGDFSWPVSGAKLTSSYGKRWGRTHKGIDLVSSNKSILSADDGIVTFAGTKSGYGNCIIVDHQNGYQTLYGHLSKISVKKGQIVEKGTKLGVMGNTGRSTGTHLHFEIHKDGSVQNPLKYL